MRKASAVTAVVAMLMVAPAMAASMRKASAVTAVVTMLMVAPAMAASLPLTKLFGAPGAVSAGTATPPPTTAPPPANPPPDCVDYPALPECYNSGIPGTGTALDVVLPGKLPFANALGNKQQYFYVATPGKGVSVEYGAASNWVLQNEIKQQNLAPGHYYKLAPGFAAGVDAKLAQPGTETYIWVGE